MIRDGATAGSGHAAPLCALGALFNGSSGPAEYRTPRGEIMSIRYIAIAAAALVTRAIPAAADPGAQWEKQWEKRAEGDKKLYEAKSRKIGRASCRERVCQYV